MAAEVLYIPAKSEDMPKFLARTNSHGAPVTALVMAAGLISLLLVALLFAADALDFMLDLTAALSLIPYLLAAAYALKLTATRETYGDGKSLVPDMVIAGLATVYTLVPDLRRGRRQAPAVLPLVRTCGRAVLQGATRARSSRLPAGRGGAVRGDSPRRRRGCGVLGNWSDRDLAATA